ncbi:MAG: RNA methyltransferase [Pirellulales bacterium]|nr:RNA methyltransferase [Pirellulales bacterium]
MTLITSIHNPRVKDAVRLRSARQRSRQGRILIDGVREIARAAGAGILIRETFFCPDLCVGEEAESLLEKLKDSGGDLFSVTEPVFEKLAFGRRREGLLAVAETPSRRLADLRLPDNPLVAVVEGLEKPGNLGAVCRSADAAGVSALLATDARTDLFNPNAIRASLGTIFTLSVGEATAAEALTWLREQRMKIYAARVDGSTLYTEADFRGPAAIVLGSEAAGLTPLWTAADVLPIRLPMLGAADSLNLSVTAAVLFYEALRQRRSPG